MHLLEAISLTPVAMLLSVLGTLGCGGIALHFLQRAFPSKKDEVQTVSTEQDTVGKMFQQGQIFYDKMVLEVERQVKIKTEKLASILMNKEIEHLDEIDGYRLKIKEREKDFEIVENGYKIKLSDATRRVSELENRIIELEKRLLIYEKSR